MTAHAFDNFPVEDWISAIERHFKNHRLSIVLTGGEPTLDRKNMMTLLNRLSAMDNVETIRVDTNAWWRPDQLPLKDKSKIILMCTFHPSQVVEEKFIENIQSYISSGFTIGFVNYVMNDENIDAYHERRKRFSEFGVVLHPNPLWGSNGKYSEEQLKIMKSVLPDHDYLYRSGEGDPFGEPCLFPALSYEMDGQGRIEAGCSGKVSSFFDDVLPPRPPEFSPCPMHECACSHKYSFLSEIDRNISTNPLAEYAAALRTKSAGLEA